MKNKLTDNLGLKILALLFSFALWLIVININDPVTTNPYYNIPVEIVNEDAITNEKKVYEIIENSGKVGVSITASRSVLDQINSGDIHVVADLSEVTFMGTVPLKASCDKYGIDSIKLHTESMKLNIEDMKNINMVITPVITGELADGYILGEVTTDQNLVKLSGPESVISRISKATVNVDVSGMTSNIATNVDIKLYDADDVPIPQEENIKKSISSVNINVKILATRLIPVQAVPSGTPAVGYIVGGAPKIEPESIQIAGSAKTLDNVKQIDIPSTMISLEGEGMDVVEVIDIRKYLPDSVSLTENSSSKVTVTVPIVKESVKTIAVPMKNIHVTNIPEGIKASIGSEEGETFEISVSGLKEVVDVVLVDQVTGTIDLKKLLEELQITQFVEGTYEASVEFSAPEGVKVPENMSLLLDIELKQ